MTSPVPNKGKGKLVQKVAVDDEEDEEEDEEEEEDEDDEMEVSDAFSPFSDMLRCLNTTMRMSGGQPRRN